MDLRLDLTSENSASRQVASLWRWGAYGFYLLIQPFVYLLMMQYGRDTGAYLDEIGGETSYLEPTWAVFFALLDGLGFSAPEAKLSGIFIVLAVAGACLLHAGLSVCRNHIGVIGAFALICSVEISAVGGSLRQGTASLFITVFLLGRKEYAFLGAIFSHWSSVVYVALRPVLFGFALALVVVYGSSFVDADFLAALGARLLSYTKDDSRPIGFTMALSLTINKLILIVIFVANMKELRILKGDLLFKSFFLVAPVLQILLLNFSGSELIFHRVGMVLDPFLNAFMLLILCRGNAISCFVVMSLVMLKFFSRFALLLS